MVCIYCSGQTDVTNSRHQKRPNSTWRRRRCKLCGSIFSTEERGVFQRAFVVESASHMLPFDRDKLFLSIYDACRHRSSAVTDATALTDAIVAKLVRRNTGHGIINRNEIVETVIEALRHFDSAAQVHFVAYHPLLVRKH